MAGAARQLMRSAASRGHSERDMDDFTRDMGGRMVIKVLGRWNASRASLKAVCLLHQDMAAAFLCM